MIPVEIISFNFEMMNKRDPDPNEISLENQSNLLDLTQKKINKICRQLHESRGACSSCSSCSRVSIVISREKLQRKGQHQTPEIVTENHEYTVEQGLLAPTHSHQH